MDLVTYYSERANEYEKIYSKPERKSDLLQIDEWLKNDLSNRDVLEIACGTGYWTERIAPVSKSIVALDINKSVLEIAQAKKYENAQPEFGIADSYNLPGFPKKFNGGLAGFWWSHVPIEKQDEFIQSYLRLFSKDALVVFFDNNYVEGSSTPISTRDSFGNSFQSRVLQDGRVSKVLKNFFNREELKRAFSRCGLNCEILELRFYWYARLRF